MRAKLFFERNLIISILIYIFIALTLYMLFEYGNYTSPRGFNLKPFESYYAINDYVFFNTGEKVVDGQLLRSSVIFSATIHLVDYFFPQGYLSILLSIIGLLYIVRLYYFFTYSSINSFVLWVFIPYFYYFSIFPSSDFLASLFILEVCILLYKNLKNGNNIRSITLILIFVILSTLTRANAITLFAIPFVLSILLLVKNKSNNISKKLPILTILLSVIGVIVFMYYYSGVLVTYINSSSEYLKNIDTFDYIIILEKFLYSFGLRESFGTIAGDGYEKNVMYVYLRILLGVMLLLSFVVVIVRRHHNIYFSKMIFIVYFLLFISASLGVSFERYFISIYPLILQFSFSAIVNK